MPRLAPVTTATRPSSGPLTPPPWRVRSSPVSRRRSPPRGPQGPPPARRDPRLAAVRSRSRGRLAQPDLEPGRDDVVTHAGPGPELDQPSGRPPSGAVVARDRVGGERGP